MYWKIKVTIILLLAAIVIGYPFFAIKYFETEVAFKITAKYFLAPTLGFLILLGPKFYFKRVKPLDNFENNSKLKERATDILAIVMMIGCSSMLFFGIFFSLIITTNSFGRSQPVTINEVVKNYIPEITRNGRLRHYIDINNPRTNTDIHLEVYREYRIGEIFKKEMNYGLWGILYSKE